MPRPLVPVLVLLSCGPAGLAAAEFAMRDIRVGLNVLPAGYDYTATGSASEVAGSDSFDSGTDLEAGIRWSWARPGAAFGVVGGLDALLDGFTAGNGGGMLGYGGRASLGLGWAFADRWQLVGEGGISYGRANLDLDAGANIPSLTVSGSFLTYDARLLCSFQAWKGIQVQVQTGWQMASYDLAGSELQLTLDRAGAMVGLGLAWRIDDSPERLE